MLISGVKVTILCVEVTISGNYMYISVVIGHSITYTVATVFTLIIREPKNKYICP